MATKKSTEPKKNRFLNMSPEQVRKRYKRVKQRQYRKALLQSKPGYRPPSGEQYARKPRPCCGLNSKNCKCKPPPGMQKSHLNALKRRFAKTPLCTAQDTTDVSTFQTLMAEHCQTVPLQVLLAYAHTHVVFNQDHLLRSFIERKAFLFKPPWFDWQLLQSFVQKSKKKVKEFAHRITEAQLLKRSGCRGTLEKRACYRATTMLLSGPSWRADSWARMLCLVPALRSTRRIQAETFGKHQC